MVKLTSFYNAVEGNFQSLMAMGLNPSHFGPLLIQVILKSLFNQINTCPKVGKKQLTYNRFYTLYKTRSWCTWKLWTY